MLQEAQSDEGAGGGSSSKGQIEQLFENEACANSDGVSAVGGKRAVRSRDPDRRAVTLSESPSGSALQKMGNVDRTALGKRLTALGKRLKRQQLRPLHSAAVVRWTKPR